MNKKKVYEAFFKQEAGQDFLKVIEHIVSSNHIKAEQEPELSRDYVQRAKGAREVLDHIYSMLGYKEKRM